MRKDIFINTLALAVLCLAFTKKVENKVTITDAVNKGMVKVKLSGKGGHSGNCLTLDIQNLKQSEMQIAFDAGRRFNSNNDEEQDLLMVRDQVITLKAGEKKKVDLSGFCCQLSNHSPSNGSGFSLGKPAEDKLLKLARFISSKAIPDHIVQEAVWCISDGQDPSNISVMETESRNEKIQNNISELRKFVCDLTGKEDPWYSTPQKRVETPERLIEPNPVEVYGAIKYEVKSSTVINSELQDESGRTIFAMPGKNVMDKGTWDYNFHLKVEGFPKGKYHVILKAGATQIMDKEFTI